MVIAAIEKLEGKPISAGRRDEFIRAVSRVIAEEQSRWASLSADFQRAIIYVFIFATGLRYLRKADRTFLRFNVRSVLLAVLLLVILLVETIVLSVLIKRLGLGVYGFVGFMYLLLMEFVGLVWVLKKIEHKIDADELGMLRSCFECGYDLSGLESVLGDELWVGPAVCPECGQESPAVGE